MIRTLKITTIDENGKNLGLRPLFIHSYMDDLTALQYEDQEYYPTGKTGNHILTEQLMVEMTTTEDERLWLASDESLIILD